MLIVPQIENMLLKSKNLIKLQIEFVYTFFYKTCAATKFDSLG